jgi:hypothetical protein
VTAGAAAIAALGVLPTAAAVAQQLSPGAATIDQLAGQFVADPLTAADPAGSPLDLSASLESSPPTMIQDSQVQPASGYSTWDDGAGPPRGMVQQPANWISGPYLKAGVALGFNGAFLGNQDPGYTISGGFRAPLGPALDERLFLDVGGSYLSVFGSTTHPVNGKTGTTIIPDLFNVTLEEVKRGMAHAAVGYYWGDVLDFRGNDPQWRIAARAGGRAGHVRGAFSVTPGIAGVTPDFTKTDTTGGLFVGVEAILLARDTQIGNLAWTIDSEYANDWIKFNNWNSGSLGTGSIMFGFMVTR